MADVKISQLPVATTPVDGTEVLPIVQSATTKQVSIANLTAGRAMSATSLTLTNPLAVTSGGTGIATTAEGAVLSATAANTFSATRTPTLGLAGTAAGTLGLSGSTSGVVTLQTAAAAGTWSMTLPTSGGSNGWILTTNGSGVTTWTNPTALGVDLDVGTTAITGGTTGRVLYNNAGVLGEYAITGTGSVVLGTSPTFTTSAIFPAGTVGAPGITTTGDTNTGIYFPAADTIGFVEGGVEAMRLDSSGNLLVGTTSATAKLTSSASTGTIFAVDASSTNDATMRWTASGVSKAICYWTPGTDRLYFATGDTGGVYLANGGTSWVSASDERVKDIIEPITDAVGKVNTLRTVIGKYKTDPETKRRSFLIAQDVQAVLPEAVDSTNSDELGLSYADVIPLLTSAIQELAAEVASLKEQLNA